MVTKEEIERILPDGFQYGQSYYYWRKDGIRESSALVGKREVEVLLKRIEKGVKVYPTRQEAEQNAPEV